MPTYTPYIDKLKLGEQSYYLRDARLDDWMADQDAMVFKGILGTGTGMVQLPVDNSYSAGWTYRVGTAGTYAGNICEVGDLVIAVHDPGASFSNDDWAAVQSSVEDAAYFDGNVITDNYIVKADGTGGRLKTVASLSGNTSSVAAEGANSSTSITPQGTISQPAFTGTAKTVNVTGSVSGTAVDNHTYTPAGSVSAPNINVSGGTFTTYTPVVIGTELSFTSVAQVVSAALAAAPTFTGTQATISHSVTQGAVSASGSYTPEGSVSTPTFTGTAASHTHTFTGTAHTHTTTVS